MRKKLIGEKKTKNLKFEKIVLNLTQKFLNDCIYKQLDSQKVEKKVLHCSIFSQMLPLFSPMKIATTMAKKDTTKLNANSHN